MKAGATYHIKHFSTFEINKVPVLALGKKGGTKF
jgi:hypothetical protein